MNISIRSVIILTRLENWMTFGSNGLPYEPTKNELHALPVVASWSERCSSIAEVLGSNPVET